MVQYRARSCGRQISVPRLHLPYGIQEGTGSLLPASGSAVMTM